MKLTKNARRKRIHNRIRKQLVGTPARPRLSVFRSNKDIYVQLIDDLAGVTLAAASSKDGSIADGKSKSEQSFEVGKLIANKAKAKSIESVIFDRAGYLYHGRVKSLAEGAREGGLKL